MEESYRDFCDGLVERTTKGKATRFPRYCQNLNYTCEGVYSYGTKIADLNLEQRRIRSTGYFSKTSSKHYNYAKNILNMCYDFTEA
jgi:hypothetical protein